MDDDLMSLRGSGSSPSGGDPLPDENPLGLGLDDFAPPPEPVLTTPVAAPAPVSKAAAPAKKKSAPKPKPKGASGGGFMGMTPQQGMLLSIFLFLDVAVLGCLVLIALGAIKL